MSSANGRVAQREDCLYERLATHLETDREIPAHVRIQLVEEFPEFSCELQDFFAGQSQLERLTSTLRGLPTSLEDTGSAAASDIVPVRAPLPQLPDYEFLEEIARGGMGIVYKVRHKTLGRITALKMIRAGDLATEEDVRRFREEAERVAQLEHPHIVPIYEVGCADGRHYFTMRLMDRGSLADRVAGGRLSPRDASQVISQVARGVHHAHQRGILHRDIKPANILFDADGTPLVGDFGLARQIDPGASRPHSTAIVGTVMYMAPEQASRDRHLTTAVDVYGLGAVLYELVTGRPPFRADSPLDTLVELTRCEPKRPRSLARKIDLDLETICLKCLEKDPERRYGSAEALANDLERWLRNEPILARRAPLWRRAVMWARRSPAAAALAVVCVLSAAICMTALIVSNIMIAQETELKDRALSERTIALEELSALRGREQRLAYLQSIALAERELLAGDTARVEQILGESPAELRGWEWHFLQRSCRAELRRLAAPSGPTGVTFHPRDGRVFVGGGVLGHPGEVAVYDGSLREELQRFRLHEDGVTAVAVSPEGGRIASASRDGVVKIWHAADGEVLATFSGHRGVDATDRQAGKPDVDPRVRQSGKPDVRGGGVWAIACSPDGEHIASAGADRAVRVWDANTGVESRVFEGHGGPIWDVCFSPDGTWIASASADRTARVWNANTGECVRTLTGHKALVRSVAFSPDGSRLVTAAYDNTARVWDRATGAEVATLGEHRSFVTSAAFSPDGERIVTSSIDGAVRVWDAATGEPSLLLHGHAGSVWNAGFSPDGRHVVSAGEDGTVRLWEATVHGMPAALDAKDRWIQRLECSDDGSRLAILDEGGVLTVWDAATDARLCEIPGTYEAASEIALSATGRHLLIDRGRLIRVFSASDARVVCEVPLSAPYGAGQLCAAGGYLAVANPRHLIRIFDVLRSVEICRLDVPGEVVERLLLSRDGTWLAAVLRSEQQEARVAVWNTQAATTASTFATDAIHICFSNRGDYLATIGDASAVAVWRTRDGKHLVTLDGHRGSVRAVTFGPDGERLFVAEEGGTVAIWDLSTRRHVLSLREASGPLDFLALMDDGSLLGASRLGWARRWRADMPAAQEVTR